MPVKRRNHGRGKKNKGHADIVRCINCGRCTPKVRHSSSAYETMNLENQYGSHIGSRIKIFFSLAK